MRGVTLEMQNTLKLRHSWCHLLSIETYNTVRGAIPGAENLRFATVFARSTHRILPCFILYNQNAHIATAACIQESALFATAACAKLYEICISLQSRAIHVLHPARCMVYPDNQNARLPTAACNQKSGLSMFWYSGVRKNVWNMSATSAATRGQQKPLLRQFSTSDEHEMTKQLLGERANSRFATVLDVRWARNDEKVVSRRGPPNSPRATKKNKKEQPFLSCHLQPSSCCGQGMVSHWTSSCCGQGLVVSYWTSSSSGHLRQRSLKEPFATLFSAAIFSHHLAVVRPWSAIEHHLAVVRGWWSAIEHHLLVAIYDNVLWKNPLLRFSQLPWETPVSLDCAAFLFSKFCAVAVVSVSNLLWSSALCPSPPCCVAGLVTDSWKSNKTCKNKSKPSTLPEWFFLDNCFLITCQTIITLT